MSGENLAKMGDHVIIANPDLIDLAYGDLTQVSDSLSNLEMAPTPIQGHGAFVAVRSAMPTSNQCHATEGEGEDEIADEEDLNQVDDVGQSTLDPDEDPDWLQNNFVDHEGDTPIAFVAIEEVDIFHHAPTATTLPVVAPLAHAPPTPTLVNPTVGVPVPIASVPAPAAQGANPPRTTIVASRQTCAASTNKKRASPDAFATSKNSLATMYAEKCKEKTNF
ncbi:unnamed protein product [Calypogeia fissa]